MPDLYLRRRHSWPPFGLHPFTHQPNKNIDEDPFSFFISDQEDDEGYVSDYMNADIEIAPRSRSLSPFKKRKKSRGTADKNRTAIILLRKWLKRMEAQYFGRGQRSPEAEQEPTISPDLLPQPFPAPPHYRGRKNLRRSTKNVGPYPRQVRSHSGRPRIWQEPGYDIWTVTEEQEDAGLGISL